MSQDPSLPLASDFPPATREMWLKLVDAVLKGAKFDDRLVARSADGLRIEPLYQATAAARPVTGRPYGQPWQIMQRADHPDPAAANELALLDLENGANGLVLTFAGATGAYGYGLEASEAALEKVLENIYLDAGATIELDLSPQSKDAGRLIADLVRRRGIAAGETAIRFGFDPLGAMAASGSVVMPWGEIAPVLGGLVGELAGRGFPGPFAAADGRVVHAAGGSEAQELAYVLATAVTYMRALAATGIPLADARRFVFFRLAADADQFLTMAKFRALRLLWARVENACGLSPAPAFISAETAWRMMTRRDPWTNLLRGTIAAFSAGLAGADAVTVLPFTAALGLSDRFARRLARNTQLILIEESNLARVSDPAAGSGGIEDLTEKLCTAAWALFQAIEKAGGTPAALEQGVIQKMVARTRTQRESAAAKRTDAITGTSEFPNLREEPVQVLDAAPLSPPKAAAAAVSFDPMPAFRLSEPFERLRDSSDEILAATGSRPKIFIANLGTASDFSARATFARNFFEAGGIEAVDFVPSPLETATAIHDIGATLAAAFTFSGAKIACLCSSDEIYARDSAPAAKTLRNAGATHLYLAGRPRDRAGLEAAGIETFIFSGCDAVSVLRSAYDILKI